MKNLISRFLYYTGIFRLFFLLRKKNSLTILMGHRVDYGELGHFGALAPEKFEKFIARASRIGHFMTLSEAVSHLKERKPFPAFATVLTFDDGFRDNYSYAYPVLKKHGIPAIVYLTFNSIDKQQLPWPQRLGWIFEKTNKKQAIITSPVQINRKLENPEDAKAVRWLIEKELYSTDFAQREKALEDLGRDFGTDFPNDKMLTKEMIQEMRDSGIFEFGAHTLSHPWCAKISVTEATNEIRRSKENIERLLQCEINHFAFPGGSLTDELIQEVKNSGYASCFDNRMKRDGNFLNDVNADPFHLRRLGLSNDCFEDTIVEMSGFYRFFRLLKNKVRGKKRAHPKKHGSNDLV